MRIVGIAGVLRPQAYVHRLLDAVALELPEFSELPGVSGLPGRSEFPETSSPRSIGSPRSPGSAGSAGSASSACFEVWDGLENLACSPAGPLAAGTDELCRVLSAADGMLITVPEHSLLPPQLAHALRWATSPAAGGALVGKPVAVITSCVSPHEAIWAQTEVSRLLGAGGAIVYGLDLAVRPGARQFNAIGRIADPVARDRVRATLREVCAAAREVLAARAAFRSGGVPSPESPVPAPVPVPTPDPVLNVMPSPVPSPLSGEISELSGPCHPKPVRAVRREPGVLPERGHRGLRSDQLLDPVDVAAGDPLG
ncbi:NADPH-dependent FMN reductase [Planobispora rosea]|uniref:NADPH-dependent FMN reductase n=1 Tax=Planobispora rosea TaxID=35762 RepID=UPI00166FC4E0|nr:NAD(P)H-dependent oxidoreductase [Planobispora rosea]